ncbi:MAG: anthranilate synthase component I [bacterium]
MARLVPSRDSARETFNRGNIVPVYRRYIADTLTPVSAYLSLTDEGDRPGFILESVEQGSQVGRYTFLGVDPRASISFKGDRWNVEGDLDVDLKPDPFDTLSELMDQWSVDSPDELPALTGGLVGYLGYEMIRFIEPTVDTKPPDERTPFPDLFFYYVDTMLIFDHVQRCCYLVSHLFPDKDTAFDKQYEQVESRLDNWELRLRQSREGPLIESVGGKAEERVESNFTPDQYHEAVEELKQAIRAGEIFQAVPSQRFQLEEPNHPFNLYRQLRSVNPSPYMYYLDFEEFQLIGSSPEILVQKEGNTVRTRPIAGTRKRGDTEQEDRELEQDLVNDEKEIAEHTMLLDLGRNDLGRVCEPGTVSVTDRAFIERYSHVMHMVSNVEGTIRDDLDAVDALKATFPAGTVSGAPKVRAMQLIEQVEPDRRGPYAGTVGYFSFNGDLDSCIIIRTIVSKGDTCYVQAGGGVVADSEPRREYEETREKARALIQAINSLGESSYL